MHISSWMYHFSNNKVLSYDMHLYLLNYSIVVVNLVNVRNNLELWLENSVRIERIKSTPTCVFSYLKVYKTSIRFTLPQSYSIYYFEMN